METVNKIDVLGTMYNIEFRGQDDDVKLLNCDGYCDTSTKLIVVGKFNKTDNSLDDLDYYSRKVLRHELIHAFLYECGLSSNSWADNEEIVDWIAHQFPKLMTLFNMAGVIK